MKVVKVDAKPEMLLQEIERLLEKNDANIYIGQGGMHLRLGKQNFLLRRVYDGDEGTDSIPRVFDSERLVLVE